MHGSAVLFPLAMISVWLNFLSYRSSPDSVFNLNDANEQINKTVKK